VHDAAAHEFEDRTRRMAQMREEAGNFGFDYRMMRAEELRDEYRKRNEEYARTH
jgi:hypothetical protein